MLNNFPKKALILTSEYYNSPNKIGSHHFAEQFAALGIEIFIISFPVSPLYQLFPKSTDYEKRIEQCKNLTKIKDNLYSFIPKTLLPPIPLITKLLPNYLYRWEKSNKQINTLIENHSFDFILCESLFFPRIIENATYKTLVVRLPDNLSGFWRNNTTLIEAEKSLIDKADIIISPSTLKCQQLSSLNPTKIVEYIANGVNIEQYQIKTTPPASYIKNKYNAVYIGAINSWFDHQLLNAVAKQKTQWHFTIIGKQPKINAPDNVSFIGEITGEDKIPYLQHANVGIIPFETKINKALIDYVNPIKMYEYLAAGIPVISTQWQELSLINAPIFTSSNATEFSQHLSKLERSPRQSDTYKDFAANFDWAAIAEQLLCYIDDEKN